MLATHPGSFFMQPRAAAALQINLYLFPCVCYNKLIIMAAYFRCGAWQAIYKSERSGTV